MLSQQMKIAIACDASSINHVSIFHPRVNDKMTEGLVKTQSLFQGLSQKKSYPKNY